MKQMIGCVSDKRQGQMLGVLCCLAYAASYLGRINYSAAMTEMLTQHVLDRTQCGTLATVYFAVYAIGQMINGVLADRKSPIHMVLIGTVGAGMTNLLMSLPMPYLLRVLLWGGNGFFQAMLWGPMLVLVSQCILLPQRGNILLGLNAAPALGTIAAYLLSGSLLWLFSWRSVFVGAGVLLLGMGVAWSLTCTHIFGHTQTPVTLEEGSVIQTQSESAPTGVGSVKLLILSGAMWMIVAAMVHGMLKDGITTWIPTYLMEEYALPSQIAVMITVIMPVVNVLGAFLGCRIVRIARNEVCGAAVFFAVAALALVLLIVVPHWPVVLCACLLSAVTAAMFGANVILVSQMPMRFETYGKTGTISGVMNATAYLGCAISTYGIADLSERWGWNFTQIVWLVCCLAALVSCLLVANKWTRFLAHEGK